MFSRAATIHRTLGHSWYDVAKKRIVSAAIFSPICELSGTCNPPKNQQISGQNLPVSELVLQWKFVWFPCNVGINLGRPGASEFKKINYWNILIPICIERAVLQARNHLIWLNFFKIPTMFHWISFYPLPNMAWIWRCTHMISLPIWDIVNGALLAYT